MLRYFVTRMARVVPVLLIVTFVLTLLLSLIPGNPAEAVLGRDSTPETLHALESQMGLDDAVPVRYVKWLGRAVTGNLGKALTSEEKVNDVIRERLPISLEIALTAQGIALLIALTLGTLSAATIGSRFDRAVLAVTSAVQSLPTFGTAIVGIIFFAVQRRWFPVTGWVRLTENPLDNLKSVALPALALGLTEGAVFTRVLRSEMSMTMNEDFVEAARGRGLPMRRIVYRHALRPSSFGLVTVAGSTLARLIGGTVVIEALFEIPGLGNKIVRALGTRDYTMIQGIAAFLCVVAVLLNVTVEMIYAWLDPRIRARAAR